MYDLVDKRAKLLFFSRVNHRYFIAMTLRLDGRLLKGTGEARVHPNDLDKETAYKGWCLAYRRASKDLVDQLLGEKPNTDSFFLVEN